MDQNDLVKQIRARLSKRLYPDLPIWEISIWTSGWMFAVGYSMYQSNKIVLLEYIEGM